MEYTVEFPDREVRILVVDDDEDDFVLLRDAITEGLGAACFTLEYTPSFVDALSLIGKKDFDVFLLDYRLGEEDGLQLLQEIRSRGIASPIILLTGQGDEDLVVSAFKAGASDYLPKAKLTPHLIANSIRYSVALFTANERRNAAEKLLKDSEARYRSFVTHLPVIICELLPDGIINYVNPAAQKIAGYRDEEMSGKRWCDIFLGNNSADDKERFMLDILSKNITNMEIPMQAKDGATRIVEWSTIHRLEKDHTLYGIVFVGIDITNLVKLRNELQQLSIIDELTRLYNRRGFMTVAQQQLSLSNRNKKEMRLAFIDLDGMKKINDHFGHLMGDAALVETAAILKKTFRESDVIARMGGDEFAVLIVEPMEIGDEIIIKRLQDLIVIQNNSEKRPYTLSLSIGIVHYNPHHPSSLEKLIASADKLMYQQKNAKKCVTV